MPLTDREKTKILKEFGKRVSEAIYQKFETKEVFLRKTGFYRKTLHDIITGKKDAHISTIYAIAKELDISPSEFFTD